VLLETRRLRLRSWRDSDRSDFAALHADPEVMADYGGPLDSTASNAKFARYQSAFADRAFARWAAETIDGLFLGYVGLMPSRSGHPLGAHADIGWRLHRFAWGKGYATEAAAAALDDAFSRCGLAEVLAYTTATNVRSQAVIARLGLTRDPTRDFAEDVEGALWHCLVWAINAPD
jgi:RimJ/RimL family protein N-acetyltransferase